MGSRQSAARQFARSAPPGRSFGRKGGRAVAAESRDRKALAVLRRRVNSMVRAINPADAIRECCDDGAFRWKGRPSEAAGPVYAPKDRRDRRLQGRSADLRAGRVRQAVELVDAHGAFFISVTHAFNTTMNGAADAQHAFLEVASAGNGAGPSLQSNANARSSSRAASLKSFKGSMP